MRYVSIKKKYGRVQMQTPNMTSGSLNGYTITDGFSGIFNYMVGYATGSVNYNNWHTYGSLQLPKPALITNFDEGNTQGYNYVGTSASITFYLNGTLVYTYNYNPRSFMGTRVTLPSAVICNKICVSSCYGSAWEGGGGGSAQETYRFNGYWAA